jgi:hypothetical protein
MLHTSETLYCCFKIKLRENEDGSVCCSVVAWLIMYFSLNITVAFMNCAFEQDEHVSSLVSLFHGTVSTEDAE